MVEHLANKYKNRKKSIVICGDNTGSDRLQIYVLRLGCSVKADVSSGYITYLAYRNSSIMQMKNKKLICFVQPHPLTRLLMWLVCLCYWYEWSLPGLFFSCFHFVMLFFSVCPPALTLPPLFHLWWQGGTYHAFHVQVEVCCYGGC